MKTKIKLKFPPADDLGPCTSSSSSNSNCNAIKKVNSQVDMDEKTGKIVSSSTNNSSSDYASNFDSNNKTIASKVLKLQPSSSSPDLQSSPKSTPSLTLSDSNNLVHGNGKHVILAVETQRLNQIDGDGTCNGAEGQMELQHTKNMNMNFNIDPTSNGSSSSTSTNNLEYTIGSNSTL